MNVLSLFSGIGGFEYGIQQSNKSEQLKVVAFSEIDKYAKSIYKKHYPNHIDLGDVTKIRTEDLPTFDFLVGGFPCQAFSMAGKRRGFGDTRGTLFFEIARILKDKKPKYFLLENVKGLLSHDKGRTFQTILRTLSELGYDVQWEIFNSKMHGVPQNRERIYIKGFLRERCGQEILSLRKTSTETDTQLRKTEKYSKENQKINSINGSQPQGYGVFDVNGISPTLTCNHANIKVHINKKESSNKDKINIIGNFYPSGHETGNVYDENGLCHTLTCCNSDETYICTKDDKHQEIIRIDRKPKNKRDHEGNRLYSPNGIASTLTASQSSQIKIADISQNEPKIEKIGNILPSQHHAYNVYSIDGLLPTLIVTHPTKVLIRNNTKQGYLEAKNGDGIMLDNPNGRGKVQKQSTPTLTTTRGCGVGTLDGYIVRKLTPIECERLQGFPDNWTKYGVDGELISDTQRYKCCGNAVTTTVVRDIINTWDMVFD